jgi:hypothetical protein
MKLARLIGAGHGEAAARELVRVPPVAATEIEDARIAPQRELLDQQVDLFGRRLAGERVLVEVQVVVDVEHARGVEHERVGHQRGVFVVVGGGGGAATTASAGSLADLAIIWVLRNIRGLHAGATSNQGASRSAVPSGTFSCDSASPLS